MAFYSCLPACLLSVPRNRLGALRTKAEQGGMERRIEKRLSIADHFTSFSSLVKQTPRRSHSSADLTRGENAVQWERQSIIDLHDMGLVGNILRRRRRDALHP
jgi:hypothetical protein